MRIRTWAVTATVAVTLATLAGVAAQAATGSTTPGRTTGDGVIHLVVTAEGSRDTFFDFEHDGLGFGDRLVARGPLTRPDGHRVGTAYLDCGIVSQELEGGKFWCRYILDLSRTGQIMTEGLDPQGLSDTFFAITGGTGDYREAEGQAEFIDSPSQTDIYITLAPIA